MSTGKQAAGLIGWLALSAATSALGILVRPGAWYQAIEKPTWTPPDAVFGPVWTVLYVLMAVAAWRVWRRGGFETARTALTVYVVQLALNGLWSFLFFGLHRPDLAFAEILVLLVAIGATIAEFRRHDGIGAALLTPYAVWVAFATVLNGAIWRLNV